MKWRVMFSVLLGFLLVGPAAAQPAGPWTWRGTLYGWFPSVQASNQHFDTSGGSSLNIERDPNDYLSNLQFVFMGALETRSGPYSVLGDLIILNFGNTTARVKSISGPFGLISSNLQSNSSTDLAGQVFLLAGGYSLSNTADPMDAIIGVRYSHIKAGINWAFTGPVGVIPPTGSAETSDNFTDVIVGLRGRASIDRNWYVPYHFDIGTGSTSLTWQALIGIGYRFGWGDVTAAYRHLAYNFKSDAALDDLKFAGPAIGVSFNF